MDDNETVRLVAGIAVMVIGLLMCVIDVSKRIARRDQHGGVFNPIWGPEQTPVFFYIGFTILIVASFLLYGTANP